MTKSSKMTFKRYGCSYHLNIETAEDLESAVRLDEAHWVATGAPVAGMNCDRTFLQLLDEDNSGRILCREVKGAISWLLKMLRDHSRINAQSKVLSLDAVSTDAPQGREVLDTAKEALRKLGRIDAEEISLEQVRQVKAEVESTPVSAAGVVLPEAATDGKVRQFITDIIATVGGVAHPGGAEGVDLARLASFVENAKAYLSWYEQGQIPVGQEKTAIMPLGQGTSDAFASFASIRDKIEQYFAQCVALALDERFSQRMGWTEAEMRELDFDDPDVIEDVLRKAPLAKAKPFQPLNFDDKINPYYTKPLEDFRSRVVEPVLGKAVRTLSIEQWQQIKSFFAGHQEWVKAKAGATAEPLGAGKLRQYLDDKYDDAVRSIIFESKRTASVLEKIRVLEKLILYQAYMIEFVNNFVSFPRLYSAGSRAMFEMGSLIMDGRRFNIAVRSGNRLEHKLAAANSCIYVLYLEVTRRDCERMEVVVPVTSGGKGNLSVGKRGVFYDVSGREYDARVLDIIENPISFREALLSPFQRLGRLLAGKIESITTAAEKKLDAKVTTSLDELAAKPAGSQQVESQKAGISRAGLLMGAGVTIAALGSSLAYIAKTVAGTPKLTVLVAVLGALLAVLLPISIVAILKLRRRDLSAILEGSGWAINASMRLTRQQSRFFTEKPKYPRGSKGVYHFWRLVVVLLLLFTLFAVGAYLFRRPWRDFKPQDSQPALSQPANENE